ncbi:MAG: PAS domain S-box protein [Ignavibacteriaceae bacterium]|nr:PAS domain S-box protein [Ignavibacteriaceae bacterium]
MTPSLSENFSFDLNDVWNESADGIRITNSEGNIVAVNPAFCQLFDKPESEIINKPFYILYHPNIQSEIIQEYKEDLARNNVKTQLERKAVLWNGRKVWFEFTNSFLKSSSENNLVLSLVRDISDKKENELRLEKSERQYRSLFNNTSDAMFVCYLNYGKTLGSFVEANEKACQILGCSINELFQKNPLRVFFDNREDEILKFIDRLNSDKTIIFNSVLSGKNNDRTPVEINSRLFDYNERPAVLFISRDIAERRDIEDKLKQRTDQLRNLASKLQSIREEERKMISREIHDELGQMLTVLKIQISLLSNKITGNDLIKSKFKSVEKLIDNSIESVQKIASKLRPGLLDELGLIPAIEWQTQDFMDKTGIDCECALPKEEIDLDQEKSTALFRIFQESIYNTARHANASKILINLREVNNQLILEVADNGKGITQNQLSDPKSLGLLGIKERALILGGSVEIKSSMNNGTTVKAIIPFSKSNK